MSAAAAFLLGLKAPQSLCLARELGRRLEALRGVGIKLIALRQYPPDFGVGSLHESCEAPAVAAGIPAPWLAWLRSLWGTNVFGVFAWDDPRPLARAMSNRLRRAFR